MQSTKLLRDHNIKIYRLFKLMPPRSNDLHPIFPHFSNETLDLLELIYSLYLIDKRYKDCSSLIFNHRSEGLWNTEIINEIEKLFLFLTHGKKINIKLNKIEASIQYKQTTMLGMKELDFPTETNASLFSGGMDSTAGVLELHDENKPPLPIHTLTNHRNRHLITLLHRFQPLKNMNLIVCDLRKIEDTAVGTDTGNMRGLLYIANSYAICQAYDISHLMIPENGPLMMNINTASWMNPTRNIHPYAITTIKSLISLLNSGFKIEGNLKDRTKAEVILECNYREILRKTHSCFGTWTARNCGLCYACLVRKYSAIVAGLNEPINNYSNNVFTKKYSKNNIRFRDVIDTVYFFINVSNGNVDFSEYPNYHYVPEGFFINKDEMLTKFAKEMLYGMKSELSRLDVRRLNSLGTFLKNEQNMNLKI